jgi:hypothetical protein
MTQMVTGFARPRGTHSALPRADGGRILPPLADYEAWHSLVHAKNQGGAPSAGAYRFIANARRSGTSFQVIATAKRMTYSGVLKAYGRLPEALR